MSHREPVKKTVDQRIFARTAIRTKEINIKPKTMRGGIRL